MKIIKKLEGSYSSVVELVDIEGEEYVLKTAQTDDIENEKEFYKVLNTHSLPTLASPYNLQLKPNQILLEYIKDSPRLGRNPSVELCREWGALMNKVHSIYFAEAAQFVGGSLQTIGWNDFISSEIKAAEERAKIKDSGLAIARIKRTLQPLLEEKPGNFSLLHADCHSNNVLIKDKELYLFDKSSEIFYGDRLYDLALIALEFPNGLYIETDDIEHADDALYLKAFIEGYGYDFTQEQSKLDLYVLLRAFVRYPNPFELYLKNVIDKLGIKYGSNIID